MRSSVRPRASRTADGILACDMKQGMLIRDFTLPVNEMFHKKSFNFQFLKNLTTAEKEPEEQSITETDSYAEVLGVLGDVF